MSTPQKLVIKKHTHPGTCHVMRCHNKTYGRKLCSTHRSQACRMNDPVKYAFINLRNNARRRSIPFTITIEDFRQWCRKVRYIGFSGRYADSYTVDRRHNDVGYHIDNIAVLTRRQNVKKYFTYDWRTREVLFGTLSQNQSTGSIF